MIKLLVVDDDVTYVSSVRKALEESEIDFIVVNDSKDALTAAIKFNPDVILLDLKMPGLSGHDVLKAIRENPSTANIEVIQVTASDNKKDLLISVRLHIADYISKSIAIGELIERVKYVSAAKAMRMSTTELLVHAKAMVEKYSVSAIDMAGQS